MPIFEYQCAKCSHVFEELVFGSKPSIKCPKCGSKKAQKLISAPSRLDSSQDASASAAGASKSCGTGGFS